MKIRTFCSKAGIKAEQTITVSVWFVLPKEIPNVQAKLAYTVVFWEPEAMLKYLGLFSRA